MFQTMNQLRLKNICLKYERFTPSGCSDRGLEKFEFVAKTQFLSMSDFDQLIFYEYKKRKFFT